MSDQQNTIQNYGYLFRCYFKAMPYGAFAEATDITESLLKADVVSGQPSQHLNLISLPVGDIAQDPAGGLNLNSNLFYQDEYEVI